MKKILYFLILITSAFANIVFAEEADIKVDWQADVSSSIQYLAHSRANIGNLGIGIQDALLHFDIADPALKKVKATFGIGILEQFNYEGTLAPFSPIDAGLHYGWLSYQTSEHWQWQMGQIENYAGLERGVSVKNDHIHFGSINNSRSFYYPGFRSIYHADALQFFAEISGPEIPNNAVAAAGLRLDYNTGNLTIKLQKELDGQDKYFNLSWSQKIAMLKLGGVIDYTLLGDNPDWQDDNALALAGYLKLPFDNKYLALRGEYFDAGNTGIYGYEKAGVITLTHGHQLTRRTFIRYEALYAKASNYAFRDDKVLVKDQFGLAMQIGIHLGKTH